MADERQEQRLVAVAVAADEGGELGMGMPGGPAGTEPALTVEQLGHRHRGEHAGRPRPSGEPPSGLREHSGCHQLEPPGCERA